MTQPLPVESIRDVRAHLAEVVERADRDDVPTVITRRGKEVAAVVSIDVLRQYQEWEEREINRVDSGELTVWVVHVGHRSTAHDT